MRTKAISAISLVATAALLAAFTAHAASPTGAVPAARISVVRVDDNCRVFFTTHADSKPKFQQAPALCHFEGVYHTRQNQEEIEDGLLHKSAVKIDVDEHVFVLTNPTERRITYAVQQIVPQGWVLDSMPHPAVMNGDAAIFLVTVGPGSTEKLHVGGRYIGRAKQRLVPFTPPANLDVDKYGWGGIPDTCVDCYGFTQ